MAKKSKRTSARLSYFPIHFRPSWRPINLRRYKNTAVDIIWQGINAVHPRHLGACWARYRPAPA